MQAAAASTGAANDGAKTTFNPALTPNTAWTSNGPQVPGTHFIISITDSASAAQYGLQTASLSRSGDDPSDPTKRIFVAPDTAGLTAGEQSFVPSAVAGVLEPDPSTPADGAYPLTMLTYAATQPETLTPAARKQYATFLLYAIGDGQTPGVETGQLPSGYVPLPGELRLAALKSVDSILTPPALPATPTTTTTTPAATTPSIALTDTSPLAAVDTGLISSPTAAPSTTTTPSTPRAPVTPVLALVRTNRIGAGFVRWALPLILLIGLGAGLGALILGRTNRPRIGSAPTGEVRP
jgi:hypothetical protein